MSATAEWNWLLCDGLGVPLAELTTASGKQLKHSRNTFTEAQFVLSHEDASAKLLLEAVERGPLPTLRCYRKSPGSSTGTLRFNGYLAPFTEELEETALMTVMFRSPFARFYGDGASGMGLYTGASALAAEKEQGAIAEALIKLYGGIGTVGTEDPVFGIKYFETSFAGLGIGTVVKDGVLRSITYPYANVGQAIINLSECLNGFDFDETFVEEGSTLALFNTYTRQGQPRPRAKFEYGPDTLSNVSKVERTTASPANTVRLIGASGLVVVVENKESVERYGRWLFEEQVTDATSASVLKTRAEALLRPNPVRTIAIFPDFEVPNCPLPFDDFMIADTVPFYGRRGAFEANMETRVNELNIVIDEDGHETASIPDPHSATAESPDLLHTVFKAQA